MNSPHHCIKRLGVTVSTSVLDAGGAGPNPASRILLLLAGCGEKEQCAGIGCEAIGKCKRRR